MSVGGNKPDVEIKKAGRIRAAETRMIMKEQAASSGSVERSFTLESDAVAVWVDVSSVTGDLDVTVYTEANEQGERREVITFPTITAPTVVPLLRKSGLNLSRIIVVAEHSDAATFEVAIRPIATADTTVSVNANASLQFSQIDVSTTEVVLIPTELEERKGITLKHWGTSGVLYVAKADNTGAFVDEGWPLVAGETFALDVAAGETVWGIADAGTIDVRIVQIGG